MAPLGASADSLSGVVTAPKNGGERPPAELPAPEALPNEAHWKKGEYVFPVGHLGDPPMEASAKHGSSGSALRLAIDGVPADTQVEGAPPKTPLARVTHAKDRFVVQFHDATHPSGDPSRYRVSLASARRWGARWLCPGDEDRFDLAPSAFRRVWEAARTRSLAGGTSHPGADDSLRVSVTGGDGSSLDAAVPRAPRGGQPRASPRPAAPPRRRGAGGAALLRPAPAPLRRPRGARARSLRHDRALIPTGAAWVRPSGASSPS